MGFGKRKKYMLQTYGNESLKKVSEKVTVFDRELNELANSMTRAKPRVITRFKIVDFIGILLFY